MTRYGIKTILHIKNPYWSNCPKCFIVAPVTAFQHKSQQYNVRLYIDNKVMHGSSVVLQHSSDRMAQWTDVSSTVKTPHKRYHVCIAKSFRISEFPFIRSPLVKYFTVHKAMNVGTNPTWMDTTMVHLAVNRYLVGRNVLCNYYVHVSFFNYMMQPLAIEW